MLANNEPVLNRVNDWLLCATSSIAVVVNVGRQFSWNVIFQKKIYLLATISFNGAFINRYRIDDLGTH